MSRRTKRLSRMAKPWPERPVSPFPMEMGNKSGKQQATRREGLPNRALSRWLSVPLACILTLAGCGLPTDETPSGIDVPAGVFPERDDQPVVGVPPDTPASSWHAKWARRRPSFSDSFSGSGSGMSPVTS